MDKDQRVMNFRIAQLQHTFRHAEDFGIAGPANKHTLEAYRMALAAHVDACATLAIPGYYRNKPVMHFVDPRTRLNVMRLLNGDYLSGWALNPMQLNHVLSNGKLGGGRQ